LPSSSMSREQLRLPTMASHPASRHRDRIKFHNDAFRKVTTYALSSFVQGWTGFSPVENAGDTTPPTGKVAPAGVTVVRLSPNAPSTDVGPDAGSQPVATVIAASHPAETSLEGHRRAGYAKLRQPPPPTRRHAEHRPHSAARVPLPLAEAVAG
jgi:hypothetical protein